MDNNTTTLSFSFQNLPVRVIERNGEPWFVGKDVCKLLGYTNPQKAMNDHCRGVTNRYPIVDSLGRTQDARILSESDVMRLICSSKLPDAVRFESWVFDEVLPAIRKTGKYAVRNSDAEKVLAEALLAATEIIREYRNGLPSAVSQLPEARQDSADEIREFFNDRGIGSFISCSDLARLLNLSRRVIKNSEAKGEFVRLDKSVYSTESVIRWLIRKPRYLTKAPIKRTLEIQRHYVPSPQQILPSPELLNMRRTPNCCPCELVRGKERLIFRCISDALRFLCIEPGTIQPKSIRNLVIDGWYFIPAIQK